MTVAAAYQKQQRKKLVWIFLLILLLPVFATVSVFLGTANVTVSGALATMFPDLSGFLHAEALSQTQQTILLELRFPRVLAAMLTGAALGMCGTIMQATTGNIMASPFTTGISSAAGLGAAIGILFHPFGTTDTSAIIVAFLLAVVNAVIVYGVTAVADLGAGGMILVGVALNFMFSAGNSLLQYIASEDQLSQIVRWTFGSLTGITWTQLALMGASVGAAFLVFMKLGWALNIMTSGGDENAKALGVDPMRTRVIGGVFVTLVAAINISFVGVIGFVGIVAPHIARLLIGSQQRILIPSSALIGALLVLTADTIGRLVISPAILPVGIVLSVIGSPIFVYLILTQRRRRIV